MELLLALRDEVLKAVDVHQVQRRSRSHCNRRSLHCHAAGNGRGTRGNWPPTSTALKLRSMLCISSCTNRQRLKND